MKSRELEKSLVPQKDIIDIACAHTSVTKHLGEKAIPKKIRGVKHLEKKAYEILSIFHFLLTF